MVSACQADNSLGMHRVDLTGKTPSNTASSCWALPTIANYQDLLRCVPLLACVTSDGLRTIPITSPKEAEMNQLELSLLCTGFGRLQPDYPPVTGWLLPVAWQVAGSGDDAKRQVLDTSMDLLLETSRLMNAHPGVEPSD
ncbi:hypothetical protein P7K49_009429 [Saguinus oedipus]|uniref:Uncharacterized protein n=1 Tax=Saguinus oedipus TaxID=9490 RepID=A0ABQ9VJZ1_SAGOE|nr:hypothetical protein P7K49_009429 [Saguinus oedipus]